jgi:serine/threonine protein phosphatase 1
VKRLVIGDIQGCRQEMHDLCEKAGLVDGDEIIAVGDVVDRGPDSPGVVEFFQTRPHARTIMGNHERKHVRSFDGRCRPALSQLITRRQFGDEDYVDAIGWMRALPTYLELPEAIVIHGFFEPGVPLRDQREDVIVGVMGGEHYMQKAYRRPWWELYDGDKPVIAGHHDYLRNGQALVYQDRVYGIDTSCCHGGALTGVLLPAFEIIAVPARCDYWTEARERNADLRFSATPDHALSWRDLEQVLASLPAHGRSLRLERLEELWQKGKEALQAIHAHLLDEHERVMAELRADVLGIEDASQGKMRAYSSRVARHPLREMLHLARKGQLTPDSLSRRYPRPADAIEMASRLEPKGGGGTPPAGA